MWNVCRVGTHWAGGLQVGVVVVVVYQILKTTIISSIAHNYG